MIRKLLKSKEKKSKLMKKYELKSTEKKEGGTVEITATIPAEHFIKFWSKALKNINESVAIDGFRKGSVPEKILLAKVGEMPVLEEMAELAIGEVYPSIVIDEKIDAIGRPEIHITKIAKDNPLEFKAITAVVPEVTLPDYKKIAKEELSKKAEQFEITEKEMDDAILRIRRSRAPHNHDHKEGMTEDEHNALLDKDLPEFNDEFAQTLGDYPTVDDFKKKLREIMVDNKKADEKEKVRILIAEKIAEESKIDLPRILIEAEINRIEAQFKSDISDMGVKYEDYLAHAKKTAEEIRKDWEPHAIKKAKIQLCLTKIAITEKISVDEKEIDEEVSHIVAHYKDADRERAYTYAETILLNEKVFQFLEKAGN